MKKPAYRPVVPVSLTADGIQRLLAEGRDLRERLLARLRRLDAAQPLDLRVRAR